MLIVAARVTRLVETRRGLANSTGAVRRCAVGSVCPVTAVRAEGWHERHSRRIRRRSTSLPGGHICNNSLQQEIKYSGTRVVPKNLRSIFIVWLRDQEGATDKILAASATAMRHHLNGLRTRKVRLANS